MRAAIISQAGAGRQGAGRPGGRPTKAKGPARGAMAVAQFQKGNGMYGVLVDGYVADGTITQSEADTMSPTQLEFLIRKRAPGALEAMEAGAAKATAAGSKSSAAASSSASASDDTLIITEAEARVLGYIADGVVSLAEAEDLSMTQIDFLARKRIEMGTGAEMNGDSNANGRSTATATAARPATALADKSKVARNTKPASSAFGTTVPPQINGDVDWDKAMQDMAAQERALEELRLQEKALQEAMQGMVPASLGTPAKKQPAAAAGAAAPAGEGAAEAGTSTWVGVAAASLAVVGLAAAVYLLPQDDGKDKPYVPTSVQQAAKVEAARDPTASKGPAAFNAAPAPDVKSAPAPAAKATPAPAPPAAKPAPAPRTAEQIKAASQEAAAALVAPSGPKLAVPVPKADTSKEDAKAAADAKAEAKAEAKADKAAADAKAAQAKAAAKADADKARAAEAKAKTDASAAAKAAAVKQQTAAAEKKAGGKQGEEKAEKTEAEASGRRLGNNMALGLGLLGAIAAAGLVLPNTIRNLLNRQEYLMKSAVTRVASLQEKVASQAGDLKLLQDKLQVAQVEYERGLAKLKTTAGELGNLGSRVSKSEQAAMALISDIDKLLTDLPSSEAQQLRKDAASIIASVAAQRNAVEKAMAQVGKY